MPTQCSIEELVRESSNPAFVKSQKKSRPICLQIFTILQIDNNLTFSSFIKIFAVQQINISEKNVLLINKIINKITSSLHDL